MIALFLAAVLCGIALSYLRAWDCDDDTDTWPLDRAARNATYEKVKRGEKVEE